MTRQRIVLLITAFKQKKKIKIGSLGAEIKNKNVSALESTEIFGFLKFFILKDLNVINFNTSSKTPD